MYLKNTRYKPQPCCRNKRKGSNRHVARRKGKSQN